MERLIRISDQREPGFFLNMSDVLPAMVPDGHAWTWAQQVVPWVTVEAGSNFSESDLEQQIASSVNGLEMTFTDLERFAARIRQVIDGEFLAAQSPDLFPSPTDDGTVVGHTAFAGIAAIDSSFWLLGGPTDVVERAIARFSDTEELDPSAWHRSEQWDPRGLPLDPD